MNKERDKLIEIFLKKNQELNLSAIRDKEWIYQKHILDSLEVEKIIKFKKWETICDIGTWWGFPLLPLAIKNSNNKFVWIDARNKKIKAIQEMCDLLEITNVKTIWNRIEDEKWVYDYITARAVGYIDKIIFRSYNILKKWGKRILYKQYDQEEKKVLEKICKQKKLNIIKEHKYTLFPWDIPRIIYIIKKL